MKRITIALALCATCAVQAQGNASPKFSYRWAMVEAMDSKGSPGPSDVTIVHLYGQDSEKECKDTVLPYVHHLQTKTHDRRIKATSIDYGVAKWSVEGYSTTGTVSCSVVPPDDIDPFFRKEKK